MNKDILAHKDVPTMSANPTIDRKTPHVIKDGNVVIQGKPLRASGNNRGVVGELISDTKRGSQTILSCENQIEEDIMMQTDLSAISKKITGSEYDNKVMTPRDS